MYCYMIVHVHACFLCIWHVLYIYTAFSINCICKLKLDGLVRSLNEVFEHYSTLLTMYVYSELICNINLPTIIMWCLLGSCELASIYIVAKCLVSLLLFIQ